MPPLFKAIYVAWFYRHNWKTCGIDEDLSLFSALQNLSNSPHIPLKAYFGEAFYFLCQYSTLRERLGLCHEEDQEKQELLKMKLKPIEKNKSAKNL